MTVSELRAIVEKYDNLGFGNIEVEIRNGGNDYKSFPVKKVSFVETSTSDETFNSFYIDYID